jgi:hypothetical protein
MPLKQVSPVKYHQNIATLTGSSIPSHFEQTASTPSSSGGGRGQQRELKRVRPRVSGLLLTGGRVRPSSRRRLLPRRSAAQNRADATARASRRPRVSAPAGWSSPWSAQWGHRGAPVWHRGRGAACVHRRGARGRSRPGRLGEVDPRRRETGTRRSERVAPRRRGRRRRGGNAG